MIVGAANGRNAQKKETRPKPRRACAPWSRTSPIAFYLGVSFDTKLEASYVVVKTRTLLSVVLFAHAKLDSNLLQ